MRHEEALGLSVCFLGWPAPAGGPGELAAVAPLWLLKCGGGGGPEVLGSRPGTRLLMAHFNNFSPGDLGIRSPFALGQLPELASRGGGGVGSVSEGGRETCRVCAGGK